MLSFSMRYAFSRHCCLLLRTGVFCRLALIQFVYDSRFARASLHWFVQMKVTR